MALSKPIAQHFHYLSSTENYLSAVDIHGHGLIVCCIKNCICLSEGFEFCCSCLHVRGLLSVLEVGGVWGMEQCCSLGSAVPLGSVSEMSCPPGRHRGTWGGGTSGAPTAAVPTSQTRRSSQPGCYRDAFSQPCLVRVPGGYGRLQQRLFLVSVNRRGYAERCCRQIFFRKAKNCACGP